MSSAESIEGATSLSGVKLHLVDCTDTAHEMMRWLSTTSRIGFDVEATGLDRQRDRVRTCQIGDEVHGWTIPWDRWGGVVEEVVARYEGHFTIHNVAYDYLITGNSCGVWLPRPRCRDTRVAAHVLHPDRSTGLKALARRYVDPHAAGLSRQLDDTLSQRNGWTWATVPVDYMPYWTYGALDPVLNCHVENAVMPRVQADAPLAYDLELASTWVSIDMSRRGARINRAYTQQMMDQFGRYIDEAERWCVSEYGVKPGQNASIIRVLTEAGFTFTKETESGAMSLDKEVLGGIDHPLAKTVLQRRRVQKVRSTYLKNFLELADEDDLIHPNINPLGFKQEVGAADTFGVKTSRMSMDHPNFQNLPRKNVVNPVADVVRNCVIAREGHTLLMVDFDQIEARIIAHLVYLVTGDRSFIDAFGHGDFFLNITRSMWGDQTIIKDDPRRQSTKNAIYARAYGAGAPKFATTAGITVEQAWAMYNQLDQALPGWRPFSMKLEQTARERYEAEGEAYVRSPLTRRKHTAEIHKLYVLVNWLVQGTAAEVLKMKLVEMAMAGLDQFMILPVHDEVILDVPNDELEEATATTLRIMNDATLFEVALTASASIGQSWGGKVAA